MAKTAWGIELGTSSVKAVKMSADKGSATLEQVEILSLKDYGLGSSASDDDATAGALNDLRVRNGIKRGDTVFVSISGQNTLGRIVSIPAVSTERVRETIQNEARSQIPIKLEEAVWDYQVIEDDDDPDELKVNLYAAKREAVERIIQICESAGLQVTGIQVAPLGIYNYIKYEMDDGISDCCVAIDIGADNTDVVIVDGQKTYVRVVPVAGNDITRALRQRFKLSTADAEKLKRGAAKSKDPGSVFEAMKPPLKEMVGEIYRAVGFYKSQNETANINQLVMMGNGSKLLNIKKFFEQQLQFQVHKVDTPQRIVRAGSIDPGEVQGTIQSLTVAIGLALQGLREAGLNYINLVPPEYVQDKQTEKLRAPFYVGGALAAAGGVIALVVAIMSVGGVDSETSRAQLLQNSVRDRSAEVANLESIGERNRVAHSLRNLLQGRVGEIPARTVEGPDGEVEVPARPLHLPENAAPGILTNGFFAAMSEYQLSGPRARLYFANRPRPAGDRPGQEASHFMWVWSRSQASLVPGTDGPGSLPVYVADRTYGMHIVIASELTAGLAADDAHATLQRELVTGGRLEGKLRQAILDELDAAGEIDLDSMTDAQRNAIRLDGVTINVTRVLPGMVGFDAAEFFTINQIVPRGTMSHVVPTNLVAENPPDTRYVLTQIEIQLDLKGTNPFETEAE
jgi:type IV pilus assembly protein PilM